MAKKWPALANLTRPKARSIVRYIRKGVSYQEAFAMPSPQGYARDGPATESSTFAACRKIH